MYDVIELSKYIINYAKEHNKTITNLQLQKILYYIQGIFHLKFNEYAFNDEIEAWRLGPVVPKIYYKYYANVGMPIMDKYENDDLPVYKEKSHKNVIDGIIEEKLDLDAWELVKFTHSEDPWKKTYSAGKNNIISKQLISTWFNNNN
nr:type II toxin-antitoxin system antitoxin SocA domain-containing protein [Sedimentibacter sp.]